MLKREKPEKKRERGGRGRRGRREEHSYEVPEQVSGEGGHLTHSLQDFHMEFQIQGSGWKTLQWTKYIMVSKYSSGREQEDAFDVGNVRNYPRLAFARVPSYHYRTSSAL